MVFFFQAFILSAFPGFHLDPTRYCYMCFD